jgi:hypothetical protein
LGVKRRSSTKRGRRHENKIGINFKSQMEGIDINGRIELP